MTDFIYCYILFATFALDFKIGFVCGLLHYCMIYNPLLLNIFSIIVANYVNMKEGLSFIK